MVYRNPLAGISTHPSDVPVNGKVLRLHFACKASLPYGSVLRVTSSSFWATMASSSTRPVAAPPGPAANSNDTPGTGIDADDPYAGGDAGIYSSSVEMVTDPDTYPL